MFKQLLFIAAGVLLSTLATAQQADFLKKIDKIRHQQHLAVSERGGPVCDPDSILTYSYTSTTDSSLVVRNILVRYGTDALANYQYSDDGTGALSLYSIDSTQYDAQGRVIFEQTIWADAFTGALTVGKQTLYYPHSTTAEYDSIVYLEDAFSTGILRYTTKEVNLFSATDVLQESQLFYYVEGISGWELSNRSTYQYLADGNLASTQTFTSDGSGGFTPSRETIYQYNNGELISSVTTDLLQQQPSDSTVYINDLQNGIEGAILFIWDGADWYESGFYRFYTDADDRLTRLEFGNNFFGFAFGIREDYWYQTGSDCAFASDAYNYTETGDWVFTGRSYYYPLQTSGSENIVNTNGISVYPNPANGVFRLNAPDGASVKVTDMQGKLIWQGVQQQQAISLPESFKGICVVQVASGQTIVTQKLIVE